MKDLNDKVHLLMDKYSSLKIRFTQQSEKNDDLQRIVGEQIEKIEKIELQYKTAKIATNFLAPLEDKEAAREQINRIVREIDDCIALLNR